jgi:hypothetical protein
MELNEDNTEFTNEVEGLFLNTVTESDETTLKTIMRS